MINFDTATIDSLFAKLEDENKIKKAGNTAIENTVNWIKEEATKAIAQQAKINPQVLNKRLYESTNTEKITGRVYIGVKKINFMKLSPVQNASGVQAGDIFLDHAFIAPAVSGSNKKLVFIRKNNKRLPLQVQKLTIDKTAKNYISEILEQVESRLVENIKQELNFNG